jgi:GxxExxY protein
MTKKYVDALSYEIIGAAIEVHKYFGPGLLESVYHKAMMHELTLRGIKFVSEMAIKFEFKGAELDSGLRCDLLVENCILTEFKAVSELTPIDEAQVMSHMNLLKKPKGILINFNCINIFKEGQRTFVNEIYRNLKDE